MLIAIVLAIIALSWSVLLTLQVYEHRRFVGATLRIPPKNWKNPPGVLVCVPCKGLDLDLADNLRCVLTQQYPKYRVRFIVEAEDDPACAVIEQLKSQTSLHCELLVAGKCTDSGQKIHNLRHATAELPYDVELLVFFDSDARPAPDAVARFVDCCFRGRVQVATGYRWFVPRRSTLPNLVMANINGAVASLLSHRGYNLIWGGSWAITRQLFEKTALAEAWRGTLSDDLVASRVMRRAGVRIAFEPGCMAASPVDNTWSETIGFLRRQFLIGRCYAPLWWWAAIPLIALQPIVLFGGIAWAALLQKQANTLWLWPLVASGVLYVLAMLRSHWRQSVWCDRVAGAPHALKAAARFDRWAAPLSCLVAIGAMLMSAVGRSIVWRGIHYHIGAAGRITLLGRMPNELERQMLTADNARRRHEEKTAGLAAA